MCLSCGSRAVLPNNKVNQELTLEISLPSEMPMCARLVVQNEAGSYCNSLPYAIAPYPLAEAINRLKPLGALILLIFFTTLFALSRLLFLACRIFLAP